MSNQQTEVPHGVKELLLKWILQRFDQEKIDKDIAEHGYSNVYSWVSGTTNSEQDKQVQAIRKSYILDESGRFHKTRVYFADDYIGNELKKKITDSQDVKLRKFKVEKEGPITFRWVIQVRPKVEAQK
jgi:hypothetical protein